MNLRRKLLAGIKVFFKWFGWVTLGFLFLAIAVIIPAWQLRGWNQFRASNNWVSATGTITKSEVSYEDGVYFPDISYEFNVRGKQYIGTNLQFGAVPNILSDSNARSWVAKYPAGSKVTVYYDPDSSNLYLNSILERVYKPNWITLTVWGMIAVVAAICGVGSWANAVELIAKRTKGP